MGFEHLRLDRSDGVATLTLDRPKAANALDLALLDELHRAAVECDQDPEVRAVLLTAQGRMFSAGGDLKFFLEQGDALGSTLSRMTTAFHAAVSLLARMDAPVVCAVNGMAAGGGLSLAVGCDVVLAAESARFTLAYTAAGLSPDGAGTWMLPRLIGLRRARELMLTNRVLSAREALECGLVDRVLPDAELADAARAQARAFAQGPTRAYGAVKRLLAGTFETGLEAQMELEARAIAANAQGEDGREGVAAFAAKRTPRFRGR